MQLGFQQSALSSTELVEELLPQRVQRPCYSGIQLQKAQETSPVSQKSPQSQRVQVPNYLRTLVPKGIKGMVFGTSILEFLGT